MDKVKEFFLSNDIFLCYILHSYYLIIRRLALTKAYQVLLQLSGISANAGLPFPFSYFLHVSFVNANFPLGKKFRVLKRAIAALVFMHMAKNTQAD
jgi:hypothetical protein